MVGIELKRWFRSQRLLLVVLVFVFSGITSPLIAAYSTEIFESLGGTSGLEIIADEPTWQDLLLSYFGNSSQIALLIACYLAAWGCALGSDDRLRIFYTSRVTRHSQIVGPRLLVSGSCVLAGALTGAAVALYETAVLAEDTEVADAALALGVQSLGLVAFALVAACLACWTNAPFLSAVSVAAVVIVSDMVGSVESFREWSPTVLVNPSGLLEGDGLADHARPAAVMAAVLVLAVGSVVLRPARRPLRPLADGSTSATTETPYPTTHVPEQHEDRTTPGEEPAVTDGSPEPADATVSVNTNGDDT
ncbi:hypothetical protein [Nocardiopsis halotolerans]|uniref:hypothetical protein n=1 Tax=Nocardiopsis halotolerans TaxID=124252 RepID=UPI0003471380|nr:hypothetical protein [Nocardiopsis halotolerans]